MDPGNEIAIRIDRTLTQDATGTLAYLQFEAMEIDRVRTDQSVSFVDHNTLQADFLNADDHRYLQSVAAKFGILFSRPGNGICHQVYLERFAKPGKTLIGSDSHTPTAGGVGMLAIGAGGLDVAVAMGGGAYHLVAPSILGIKLVGSLHDYASAKDVILEVLRRIGVKGGIGKILEYFGPGIQSLAVPERATITNMGAETGATSSVFPSDKKTKEFLTLQRREEDWTDLSEGNEDDFDEVMEIDLDDLEPLVAKPHSPGNVIPLSEILGLQVDQVAIGSCTNSSLKDLVTVAMLLKDRKIHAKTALGVSPGSRQVLHYLAENGHLADIISSGARVLECACGPCIGMGFAPPTKGVSLRTFNRNFRGRSGTADAEVYLVSPEVAVASAVFGEVTDPRELGQKPKVELLASITIDDSLIVHPPKDGSGVEILRGPNIVPIPKMEPLPANLPSMRVLIKLGDDITTDHIMPAGAKILPLRSNLPNISRYVFEQVDPSFVSAALLAKDQGGGVILAGNNYGQGSSREHAALAPMYLGVKMVLAKSFSRIHRNNLINFGIIPFTFVDPSRYDRIEVGNALQAREIRHALENGKREICIFNKPKKLRILMQHDLSDRERAIILAGGLLNHTREGGA